MAWIYLVASEESQKPYRPGSKRSPTVRTTPTLKPSYFQGCRGVKYTPPLYGTMLLRSRERDCRPSKLSRRASLARTYRLRDAERAWQESEAVFFSRSLGLFGTYDPALSFWRTPQASLFPLPRRKTSRPLLELWRAKWPRSGMIVAGLCYQLSMWERRNSARGGGVSPDGWRWATPTAAESRGTTGGNQGRNLRRDVKMWPTPTARDWKNSVGSDVGRHTDTLAHRACKNQGSGQLNPTWVEWLMGYPLGVTELSAWALAWFRSVRGKRSRG